MRLPKEVQRALLAENTDMISWSVILNFFSEHKHKLSYFQKRSLYLRSEQFREFWNTAQETEVKLKRPSGETVKIKNVRESLDITIDKIRPNDIYKDQTISDNPLKTIFRQFLTNIKQFFSSTIATK